MEKIVQIAGRNVLGGFAPEFAHYSDDILFGESWSNQDIDHKTRCIIMVVALMSFSIAGSLLRYHLENAKKAGVTKAEIVAVIIHVAFYTGWLKGQAVFNTAKEVWIEDSVMDAKSAHENGMVFPIGVPSDAYAQYSVGQSYLSPVSISQVGVFNVTFESGCRNNWHIHNVAKGGSQILIRVAGHGYYQERGKDAIEMNPGDYINIPVGVKHWHDAVPDSWFLHLAIEVPGEDGSNKWSEAVGAETYGKLKQGVTIIYRKEQSVNYPCLKTQACNSTTVVQMAVYSSVSYLKYWLLQADWLQPFCFGFTQQTSVNQRRIRSRY